MVFLFIHLKELKVMNERRKRRSRSRTLSHLGLHACPQETQGWNGNLARRWDGYFKMKGIIFAVMYGQTAAMDAQKASDLLGRIMDLSSAATTAAQAASAMIQSFSMKLMTLCGTQCGASSFSIGSLSRCGAAGDDDERDDDVKDCQYCAQVFGQWNKAASRDGDG